MSPPCTWAPRSGLSGIVGERPRLFAGLRSWFSWRGVMCPNSISSLLCLGFGVFLSNGTRFPGQSQENPPHTYRVFFNFTQTAVCAGGPVCFRMGERVVRNVYVCVHVKGFAWRCVRACVVNACSPPPAKRQTGGAHRHNAPYLRPTPTLQCHVTCKAMILKSYYMCPLPVHSSCTVDPRSYHTAYTYIKGLQGSLF